MGLSGEWPAAPRAYQWPLGLAGGGIAPRSGAGDRERQMKTPDPTKAESSAPNKRKFTGTDNPRHLRFLAVLLRRPIAREELDHIAGCSNGPDLVAELRRRGLGKKHLPCERIRFIDRDGYICRPGVYSLTKKIRSMVYARMVKREKASTQKKLHPGALEGFNGSL
jgi:hypothetical protein